MLELHEAGLKPGSVEEIVVLDLRHRLKNVYAIVCGVLALSARAQPEMAPFVAALRDRIAALEAAHAYLNEGRAAMEEERTVMGLLRLLVAPFNSEATKTVTVAGRDAAVKPSPGAILALIVRELATNSLKYGALSAEGGHVEIACGEDRGCYTIQWRERGGPRIERAPEREGFGTDLVARAAASANFSVAREWRPGGLKAEIVVPREGLVR
jgi:two-component sensor histidine kinase